MGFLHPDHETLRQLAEGEVRSDTRRFVERHLTDCVQCREAVQRLIPQRPPRPEPRSALARHAAQLEEERRVARVLEEVLGWHPPEHQEHLIRTQARFQNWALCERLIATAVSLRFQGGDKLLAPAKLAIEVASAVPENQVPSRLRQDLQSRAWAEYGNAQRIIGDRPQAKLSLDRAALLAQLGSGDPLLALTEKSFRMAYLVGQSKDKEALLLFRKAVESTREIGDRHLEGRLWMREMLLRQDRGEWQQSQMSCLRARRLLDFSREPQLQERFEMAHGLQLAYSGFLEPGARKLARVREVFSDNWSSQEWMEWKTVTSKVCFLLGDIQKAKRVSKETCDFWREQGDSYRVAQISVDLLITSLVEGSLQGARNFAGEARERFQDCGVSIPTAIASHYRKPYRERYPEFDRYLLG